MVSTVQVPPLAFDLDQRLAAIDREALKRYRLSRLRVELQSRDYAGAVLCDPMNIDYATGQGRLNLRAGDDDGRGRRGAGPPCRPGLGRRAGHIGPAGAGGRDGR